MSARTGSRTAGRGARGSLARAALPLVAVAVLLGAVTFAAPRTSAEASYLVVVVASQLVSPILWSHYALLLLLPTAWLLQRGLWGAAALPLVTA